MPVRGNAERFPCALMDMILAQSLKAIIINFLFFFTVFTNKKTALERLSGLPKICIEFMPWN